jgi:hypothetical protein
MNDTPNKSSEPTAVGADDQQVAFLIRDALAELVFQVGELHRHRDLLGDALEPERADDVSVPFLRHRRRRPQPLERPRQQTRHLNNAQLPGRGEAFRPGLVLT